VSGERVPFTILTGFLGAGKTTVLNRILGAPQGRRIAVLVNELGRIAIDSKLILSRGGDVLELAGGCVCCKVDTKNDLWDGIAEVAKRAAPDHIVLETTGIAEPAAILDGLDRRPEVERGHVRVAGTVCVVDAPAALDTLSRREEAREQVEAADRLLLSKLDLTDPEMLSDVHKRLAELNGEAERAAFPGTEEATRALTLWLLEERKRREISRRHHSHSQGQLVAATFVEEAELVPELVIELIESMRDRLYRVKGFVRVAGSDRLAYVELAGQRVSLRDDPDVPTGTRTELVFIGEGFDEAVIRRRLWACRAS